MVNLDFLKKKSVPTETVEEEFHDDEIRGSSMTKEDFYDKYTVPSDFKQVLGVVLLEFKHFLKTKSFFILFILGMIVPLIQMSGTIDLVGNLNQFFGAVSGSGSSSMSANTYMHFCMCLLPLIMLLCMVFFCGKTISNEYAERTAFLNLPLPIKRWTIFTGKFIAISAISFSIVLFSFGMAFLATSMKYDQIILAPLFQSIFMSLICTMALVATGMLFSSVFRKRGGAMGLLIMMIVIPLAIPLAFTMLESLLNMGLKYDFLQFTLPFIIDDAFLLISWDPMLSIPCFFTIMDFKSMPSIGAMFILAIVWGALCFAGGLYMFNKKEV